MSNYAHPEVLVDTQWVAEHLNDPKVRIVELGYDTSDYVSGHIPGAVGWGWSTDLQHPIRKDLPDKEGIEELLARSGIENQYRLSRGLSTPRKNLIGVSVRSATAFSSPLANRSEFWWMCARQKNIMVSCGMGGDTRQKPASAVVISPAR
jgi:hypothetical protein